VSHLGTVASVRPGYPAIQATEVYMKEDYVVVFTREGMGEGPIELQRVLAAKFLALTLESQKLPSQILFYTNGVKLACAGSPVLELLKQCEAAGVELVLCKTCLDFFGLTDQVQVGVVGGMGDILAALQHTSKVIHL
jgi:sulfur relay (sulfurtransferase) complex TusBCD TusD component (DsrE family)